MAELIISREFLLASYYAARDTLDHDQAIAHVAEANGQTAETVERVLDEEVAA